MIQNSIWTEKYRPQNLDEYIGNDDVKKKIKNWLDQGDVPSLLLYGSAGGGKTSLAKLIAKHLDADVMYINASDENSVDVIRDKINGFASTIGFSQWKIVILDEADFTTANFQAALRNVLESTSKTCRFILTCNYLERLIEPIRSRLMEFHIVPPDKLSVAKRCKEILDLENVNFDPKDVIALIEQGYPDIRKIIGTLQRNSLNGSLKIENQERLISDYCSKILEELKQGSNAKQTYQNIRQIIAESKVRQFDDLFRLLFDKLEEWVPDGKRSSIILVLAEFQQRTWLVQVDKEIQIAAMFVNILKELQ